jgi:demethylphylloquinone reductase
MPIDPACAAPGAPVVIVGGGFGGLYTALALAETRQHPPILLIEPRDRFVFLPLLYELFSHELRSWEIAPGYDSLLAGRGVAWLQDRVTQIDAVAHEVVTATGRRLAYSQAVIASGSTTQTFGIPGAAEHSLRFRTLADVQRLQQVVARLRQQRRPLQRLAVVGAGASGVELACKLADVLTGCALVELIERGPTVLPAGRSFNREQALLALQRRDVRVRTNTPVAAVATDHLLLGSPPERLAVDGVIWTAGIHCSPPQIVPAELAPQVDPLGRLPCTDTLAVEGLSDLFALGDGARLNGDSDAPLPSTAQVAFQQADCLAANLQRAATGEPLQPFSYRDLGEMLSLGQREACLTGGGFTLAGRAAFELRKLAYLTRLPGRRHQVKVAAGWLGDWGR